MTISGANTFGGGLWVRQGSVKVNNAQALGTTRTINGLTYYPQVTVDSGATLNLNGFSLNIGGLRGSGTLTDNNPSGLTIVSNIIPGAANIWFFPGTIIEGGNIISYRQYGDATQVLSGINTYTGNTEVHGGVLRADLGVGLPGTVALGPARNLTLNGGAWETTDDINLTLGIGINQVQLPAGASGFSAYGTPLNVPVTVSLNGGAGLIWGVTAGFNPDALVLQGPWANRPLNFQNSIDLHGATRIITVNADPTTPMYDPQWSTIYPNVSPATITGAITNIAGPAAGLTKSGPGILVLANNGNSYNGPTSVDGGVLRAVDGATLPAGNLNLTGGVFETSGFFSRGLGGLANQVQLNGFNSPIGFSAWDSTGAGTVVKLGGAMPTPLVWGVNLNATALRLNDVAANAPLLFTNDIDLKIGRTDTPREINVRAVRDNNYRATISGKISNTGEEFASLIKSGQGVLELTGANTYDGRTIVTGGVLRAVDQCSVPTGSLPVTNLKLMGGVFETGIDFTRNPGPNNFQVQLYAEPPSLIAGGASGMQYPSGFSARLDPSMPGGFTPGSLTVALGGTATPTPLTWDPGTAFCPNPLILNAETANAPLVFMNPIDLNNMPRQVDVNSLSQPATMSGKLSGGGSLVKEGPGELILIAVNSYIGGTTINEGTLALADGGQISTSSLITNNATFLIVGGVHTVNNITGTGTTQVIDGGQLTAPSIVQDRLIIGDGSGMTIAPIPGSPLSGSSLTPVPEPSVLVLLAIAGLGILPAAWKWKKR